MRHSFLALGTLTLFALVACEATAVHSSRCTSGSDCPAGQVCVDSRCVAGSDGGGGDGSARDSGAVDAYVPMLTGIHVEPPAATLTATDGAMPTVSFAVFADYSDGSSAPYTGGFWTVDHPVLGTIDRTTGLYTAAGIVAGTATVSVGALGLTATGTVTIAIARTVIDTGTPADAATHFSGAPTADPSRAANILYPLEGTVFPGNVFPADLQWDGGNAGDIYQLRIVVAGVTVHAYVLHSGAGFGYHWLPTRDAWRALAESAPEATVTLSVDRWDSSTDTVITGTDRTFRYANASIRGAIYYWDLGAGHTFRIRGDGTGLEDFMPNPPRRPSDGRQCIACHAISRDGRRMAAELWDGGDFGAVFDLTGDTTADPPPMIITPTLERFLTATFDPTASRLLASEGNGLFLLDGNTGARIAAGGSGLPSAAAAHPSWSPDGSQVAFVTNTDGGWAVDFTRGDLAILDVSPGDVFGAPRTILTGSPLVVARPTWSPDSGWIAFQHGTHSRAFQDPGGGVPSILQNATVRMVSRDGATVFDLGALNGGDTHSFYPTFSPFDEGGYFWLAFLSTRDYGNAQVGTRGTSRRQLWVAAIDSTPTPGTDPSASAYWLPQQNVMHQNMAAFWTQEPCRADGLSCAVSADCCSGFCRDTGAGPMCVPPGMVSCSHEGEACATDADCCAGDMTTCVANRCTRLG